MLPIALPQPTALRPGARLLAADIGGTKCHFAVFEVTDDGLTQVDDAVLPSRKFDSLVEAIRYFAGQQQLPDTISIAFAGPVRNGCAHATNLGWTVDAALLAQELGVPRFYLLNDLEAAAYGLGMLGPDDLLTIWSPSGGATGTGNAALLSPGTGLGEAGLFWDGQGLHPFATEGGHADFAARRAFDWELLLYLQQAYGEHVSWERVLSGPGMVKIYEFLRDKWQWKAPEWLQARMIEGDPAAAIGQAARGDCQIARETQRVFVQYLAEEASNLALKFNATGGVFIGGGIIPKIWSDELQEVFLAHFFRAGRLRPLLESMPVHIVLQAEAPLLGAAFFAAGQKRERAVLN